MKIITMVGLCLCSKRAWASGKGAAWGARRPAVGRECRGTGAFYNLQADIRRQHFECDGTLMTLSRATSYCDIIDLHHPKPKELISPFLQEGLLESITQNLRSQYHKMDRQEQQEDPTKKVCTFSVILQ